jgi:hypothetical protein
MKYEVFVRQIADGSFYIEAENKEEAWKKAEDEMDSADIEQFNYEIFVDEVQEVE